MRTVTPTSSAARCGTSRSSSVASSAAITSSGDRRAADGRGAAPCAEREVVLPAWQQARASCRVEGHGASILRRLDVLRGAGVGLCGAPVGLRGGPVDAQRGVEWIDVVLLVRAVLLRTQVKQDRVVVQGKEAVPEALSQVH